MSFLSIPYSGPSAKAAGASFPTRLIAALRAEWRLRRAMRDVAELDDAALMDIGLTRGGIESAVRRGRRRGP